MTNLSRVQSNAATISTIRANGGKLGKFAIPESIDYLKRVGYTVNKNTLDFRLMFADNFSDTRS